MKKTLLITLLTGAVTLTAAQAAVVVNFGANNVAGMNNYTTPPQSAYGNAGGGNLTTTTSGTAAGSGNSYNSIQTFNDTNGTATLITLNIGRTGGKVFNYSIAPAFSNTTAVNEISSATGISSANISSALTTFVASAAGGSRIDTVSLNNLGMAGDLVTLFFGASTTSQDNSGVLTSLSVAGGTDAGTISFAGQGGNGFDQATLAGSAPTNSGLTLFKWVGTVGTGDSLTVSLDASDAKKSGLGFVAVSAIPEPSSTALLGLGGLALILRRRK